MGKILITVESGSDMPEEFVKKYNITVVPMYVGFGDKMKKDGSFDPEDIIKYYEDNSKITSTSGNSPADFDEVFDRLHEENPDAEILHIAYSGVTTCSCQSARIAAEERPYVRVVDSKQCTGGHSAVAVKIAEAIEKHPEWTVDDAVEYAEKIRDKTHMFFIPTDLKYLKAGGRCSNLESIAGTILRIKPMIEVLDGYLKGTRKYRGTLDKVVPRALTEFVEDRKIKDNDIWFFYTIRFSEEDKEIGRKVLKNLGFQNIYETLCHGVITTHGGPNAFGLAGFEEI